MASEDVIELGSSDDEATPTPPPRPRPPAKNKTWIPPKLNAMVHIPQKIHGVTIKPTKTSKQKSPGMPVQARGSIHTSNFLTGTPNNPIRIKPLQTIVKRPQASPKTGPKTTSSSAFTNPAKAINPLSLMKNLDKSQIVINKVKAPAQRNVAVVQRPVKVLKQVPIPNPVPRLAPGLTITKTQGIKRPIISNVTSLRKKQKVGPPGPPGRNINTVPKDNVRKVIQTIGSSSLVVNPMSRPSNILTVELDDEVAESGTSSNNPSWYLRPEDQTNEEAKELEKLNNKEPESPKFIEITIEDSPVSKPKNRRASEFDNSITIDDSPVRGKKTPKKNTAGSDSDDQSKCHKTPKKRKKLEYPMEVPILEKSIEIEIDPIQIDTVDDAADKCDESTGVVKEPTPETTKDEVNKVDDTVIEIIESPIKKKKMPPPSHLNQTHTKPKLEQKRKNVELELVTHDEKFHPIYQQFINLCIELDSSNDMKTIVEKKIKGYYKQVAKEYTESEEFLELVTSKMVSMKANKDKMYLYIKDVVDELNVQRKIAKNQLLAKETEKKESGKLTFTDDSEFDAKRQRQIRKLEKTIQKLHRAIQKLEEQEVDFDDEDDSVYLLTERYKERMVRVHAKLCQLTNTKLPSEPRVHIESRPGQPTGPAKRLEKWINKKVPIGKPLPFPDFHDVLRIVREANSEDKLGWNEADIMEEARDLFSRCGKKLQRRRQEIEWRIAASRLPADVDPADTSEDLKNQLERNRQLASKKEIEVFNKYADRQSEMKLVAEEIGDKEAEESPVESEDDDVIEETSALEDKEKRKERLKRLIQEKSNKKSLEEKDSQIIRYKSPTKSSEGKDDSQNIDEKSPKKAVEENDDSYTVDENCISLEISPDANLNDDKDPLESKAAQEVIVVPDLKVTESDKTDTQLENMDPQKVVESNVTEEKVTKTTDAEMKDTNTTDMQMKDRKASDTEIKDSKNNSDVDELHLLEKLYSQSENSSTANSSDSDTPIDISDTVESDDPKQTGVISIENSSESDTQDSKSKDSGSNVVCEVIEEIESSQDAHEYDEEKEVKNDFNDLNGDNNDEKCESSSSNPIFVDKVDAKDESKTMEVIEEIESSQDALEYEDEKKVDSASDPVQADSQNCVNNDIRNSVNEMFVSDDKTDTEHQEKTSKDCDAQKSYKESDKETLQHAIDSIESVLDSFAEDNATEGEQTPMDIDELQTSKTECENPKHNAISNGETVISEASVHENNPEGIITNGPDSNKDKKESLLSSDHNEVTADSVEDKTTDCAEVSVSDRSNEKNDIMKEKNNISEDKVMEVEITGL